MTFKKLTYVIPVSILLLLAVALDAWAEYTAKQFHFGFLEFSLTFSFVLLWMTSRSMEETTCPPTKASKVLRNCLYFLMLFSAFTAGRSYEIYQQSGALQRRLTMELQELDKTSNPAAQKSEANRNPN
jgi:hypothetical protein